MEKKSIISLNKSTLQVFISKLVDNNRKILIENEKNFTSVNQVKTPKIKFLNQDTKDITLEDNQIVYKPSKDVITQLEKIQGQNEIDYFKKEDHSQQVKWLFGLIMLLFGKKELVAIKDPDLTWRNSKTFLVDLAGKGGIGIKIQVKIR